MRSHKREFPVIDGPPELHHIAYKNREGERCPWKTEIITL